MSRELWPRLKKVLARGGAGGGHPGSLPAWISLLLYSGAIFVQSHRPVTLPMPSVGHIDKVYHAVAYAIYGGLAALALSLGPGTVGKRRVILVAALLGTAYGASDEIHQGFVEGRDGDFLDFLADAAGAFVGAFVLVQIRSWWLERGARSEDGQTPPAT